MTKREIETAKKIINGLEIRDGDSTQCPRAAFN